MQNGESVTGKLLGFDGKKIQVDVPDIGVVHAKPILSVVCSYNIGDSVTLVWRRGCWHMVLA